MKINLHEIKSEDQYKEIIEKVRTLERNQNLKINGSITNNGFMTKSLLIKLVCEALVKVGNKFYINIQDEKNIHLRDEISNAKHSLEQELQEVDSIEKGFLNLIKKHFKISKDTKKIDIRLKKNLNASSIILFEYPIFISYLLTFIEENFDATDKLHSLCLDELSSDKLEILTEYISIKAGDLPIELLDLHIDEKAIKSEDFAKLMKVISRSNLKSLKIRLDYDLEKDKFIKILHVIKECTKDLCCDLEIVGFDKWSSKIKEFGYPDIFSKESAEIYANIIRNIYSKKQLEISSNPNPRKFLVDVANSEKNLLKEQFIKKNNKANLTKYVQINVEHTEEQELVHQLEETQELNQEIKFESQADELDEYADELVSKRNFTEYFKNLYGKETEEIADIKELFSSLPKRIRYLTPASAEVILANYKQLASLNLNNLPSKFVIKKDSEKGCLVLDYDPNLDPKEENIYIPHLAETYKSTTLYNVKTIEDVLDQENPNWKNELEEHFKIHPKSRTIYNQNKEKCLNFLIKSDINTLQDFLFRLSELSLSEDELTLQTLNYKKRILQEILINCDSESSIAESKFLCEHSGFIAKHILGADCENYEKIKNEELSQINKFRVIVEKKLKNIENEIRKSNLLEFLTNNYLNYFENWNHFANNDNFYNFLTEIRSYNSHKLACFQRFIVNTGSSNHDIHTVKCAFENFWKEFKKTCEKEKIDSQLLNLKTIFLKDAIEVNEDILKDYYKEIDFVNINILGTINGLINQYQKDILENNYRRLKLRENQEIFKPINWYTPKGGSPVVYIQRMLEIIKNSRNFTEQLYNLDNVSLDNNKYYYMTSEENFKLVVGDQEIPYRNNVLTYCFHKNDSSFSYKSHRNQNIKKIIESFGGGDQDAINQELASYVEKEFYNKKRIMDRIGYSHNNYPNVYAFLDPVDIFSEINPRNKVYENQELKEKIIFIKDNSFEISKEDVEKALKSNQAISYKELMRLYELDPLIEREPLKNIVMSEYKLKNYYHPGHPYRVYKLKNDGSAEIFTLFSEVYNKSENNFAIQQEGGLNINEYLDICSQREYEYLINGSKRKYEKYIDVFGKFAFTLLTCHERQPANINQADYDDFCLKDRNYRYFSDYSFRGSLNNNLLNLWQKNIKINLNEAVLIRSIYVRTEEHEDTLKKIFKHIENNLSSTMEMLECLDSILTDKTKFVVPSIFDTFDFFVRDESIKFKYKRDLLLFSLLINNDEKSCYKKTGASRETFLCFNEIKSFLQKAAEGENNNNLGYAFKLLIKTRQFIAPNKLIELFKQISNLPNINHQRVEEIFTSNGLSLKNRGFSTLKTGSSDIRGHLISGILTIIELTSQYSLFKKKTDQDDVDEDEKEIDKETKNRKLLKKLEKMDIPSLQKELLNIVEHNTSSTFALVVNSVVNDVIIPNITRSTLHGGFIIKTGNYYLHNDKIKEIDLYHAVIKLPELAEINDFQDVGRIIDVTNQISPLLRKIINNRFTEPNLERLQGILNKINFANFEAKTLGIFLNIFADLYSTDYLNFLEHLINCNNKSPISDEDLTILLDCSKKFNNSINDRSHFDKIFNFCFNNIKEKDIEEIMKSIINKLSEKPNDKILPWIISQKNMSWDTLKKLTDLLVIIEANEDKILEALKILSSKEGSLKEITDTIYKTGNNQKRSATIFTIFNMSLSANNRKDTLYTNQYYKKLIERLGPLSDEDLSFLESSAKTSNFNINALEYSLNVRDKMNLSGEAFRRYLEKSPFGERDLRIQYSTSEVGRVVNNLHDPLNETKLEYSYRKSVMEAMHFVNRAGYDLPIYGGLPAKELSNEEIRAHLKLIRENPNTEIMHKRLYALPLMREAMYRATGQFPYSTQMIALIDSSMKNGNNIQNISTGQGKSLIDTMKGALLWMNGSPATITTSSIIDANRDITNYGKFFDILDIPYCNKAITSKSELEDFRKDGVNYTTFAQLSLFRHKAEINNFDLGKVNLVINEQDYSILDDRVIYRYAISVSSKSDEWIYDAIVEYAQSPEFVKCKTSSDYDVHQLRQILKSKAVANRLPATYPSKFDDEQLLVWINSAILALYGMKENKDYVVQDNRIKILMKDGKISEDTKFGNGVHQILCAYYNSKERGVFEVEPESKAILTSNNKNLIDVHKNTGAELWGSSGTIGSNAELKEQYDKYGFKFTYIDSHQPNVVKYNEPLVVKNYDYFNSINDFIDSYRKPFESIANKLGYQNKKPLLIFLKDIDTVNKYYDNLPGHLKKNAQIFTGKEKEEEIIEKAAMPGMVTITTSAIGRNTDILYDKKVGMDILHGCLDSFRREKQKSGRTGRQGSPGSIYYIFNKSDLRDPFKSLQEVKQEMDEAGRIERQFNEEFYDIIHYLYSDFSENYTKIYNANNNLRDEKEETSGVANPENGTQDEEKDLIKDAQYIKSLSIKKTWSKFLLLVEGDYKKFRQNNSYEYNKFLDYALKSYKQSVYKDSSINLEKMKEDLSKKSPDLATYFVHNTVVKKEDCIRPELIASHILENFSTENSSFKIDEKDIKSKLDGMFKQIIQGKTLEPYKTYLELMSKNSADLNGFKEISINYLENLFKEEIARSKNMGFLKRWLGFQAPVNKIVNNLDYLSVIKGINNAGKSGKKLSYNSARSLVTCLMEEYLKTNWFVSKTRKESVSKFIKDIEGINDVTNLMDKIAELKTKLFAKDVSANANSWWRWFKPINYFGNSRLQTSLDNSLILLEAVSSVPTNDYVSKLYKNLEMVYKKPEEFKNLNGSNLDDIEAGLTKPINKQNFKDKYNALAISNDVKGYVHKLSLIKDKNLELTR